MTDAPVVLPEGEYAIVEVLGHRTIVGRISEVERFGTKLLAIEPIWEDRLLPPVLIGGASIYQLTSCSPEVALAERPEHHWQLPASIRVTVPKPALPSPARIIADGEDADWFSPDSEGGWDDE